MIPHYTLIIPLPSHSFDKYVNSNLLTAFKFNALIKVTRRHQISFKVGHWRYSDEGSKHLVQTKEIIAFMRRAK